MRSRVRSHRDNITSNNKCNLVSGQTGILPDAKFARTFDERERNGVAEMIFVVTAGLLNSVQLDTADNATSVQLIRDVDANGLSIIQRIKHSFFV